MFRLFIFKLFIMKNLQLLLVIIFFSFFLDSWTMFTTVSVNSGWIEQLVTKFKNEPVGNPPQSIWQYEYKGAVVYYVPPQCCDQYSTLYNENGERMCAPDGGQTGQGDGLCSDFYKERKNKKLIWQDCRTK